MNPLPPIDFTGLPSGSTVHTKTTLSKWVKIFCLVLLIPTLGLVLFGLTLNIHPLLMIAGVYASLVTGVGLFGLGIYLFIKTSAKAYETNDTFFHFSQGNNWSYTQPPEYSPSDHLDTLPIELQKYKTRMKFKYLFKIEGDQGPYHFRYTSLYWWPHRLNGAPAPGYLTTIYVETNDSSPIKRRENTPGIQSRQLTDSSWVLEMEYIPMTQEEVARALRFARLIEPSSKVSFYVPPHFVRKVIGIITATLLIGFIVFACIFLFVIARSQLS